MAKVNIEQSPLKTKTKSKKLYSDNDWHAIWFILPSLLTLLLLVSYPLLYGLYISGFDTNLMDKWDFVGASNYLQIFSDAGFLHVIWITLKFTAMVVFGNFVIGTLLAVILNMKIPGRTIFRGILVLPWLFPEVVVALLWRWLFNPLYGLISHFWMSLGFGSQPLNILGDTDMAIFGVAVAAIWKGYPLVLIIVLAGLQAIPNELYEAAEIDGANIRQQFFNITLPSLLPVVTVVLILETVWWFKNFPIVWILTQGGPVNSTEVISIGIFQTAFESFRFGEAAAMAVVVFFICLLISYLYRRFLPNE